MHTCSSNSELVKPLPEPERTLNRRLHRRNRRVPFNQRNSPPQNPRIVYPPILDINHFRHFLVILENLYPMDDEPMWVADRVVAPTPGSAITILETANEFAIKEEKTWLDELNEGTIESWDELRTAFISRFFPPTLFDRLIGEIRAFSQHENESLTDAWLCMKEMLQNCHGHNLSKGNIIKILYHGLSEITQKVLNAAAGGIFLYKTTNQAYQLLEDKQLTNAFVKETFMDLKTQLKTVAKNHQASIQNLETKFDRLADKQSGQHSGSLPSNTQPNPKGHNSKAYQPPQSHNEHVNAVFTRSGKSYNPPVNLNDQQENSETPYKFNSD
ncbi:reverse transcriptase domain-containing protein [Tanacetum coccineum]